MAQAERALLGTMGLAESFLLNSSQLGWLQKEEGLLGAWPRGSYIGGFGCWDKRSHIPATRNTENEGRVGKQDAFFTDLPMQSQSRATRCSPQIYKRPYSFGNLCPTKTIATGAQAIRKLE
jgi:hypothetical protein